MPLVVNLDGERYGGGNVERLPHNPANLTGQWGDWSARGGLGSYPRPDIPWDFTTYTRGSGRREYGDGEGHWQFHWQLGEHT